MSREKPYIMYYKSPVGHRIIIILLTKLSQIAKKSKKLQFDTCKKVSVYGTMFYNNLNCGKQADRLKNSDLSERSKK